MKITEFQPELQKINHQFSEEMQKRDDLAEREIAFDQFDWMEEYMAWMVKQHRHVEDPVRVQASASTLGPSVDPARGERPKMGPIVGAPPLKK